MWGDEEQKKRYFLPSTRGEKILAFGLTEPEACSNPVEMKMTYDSKGSRNVLKRVMFLTSNAGIAHAIVAFTYREWENRGIRVSVANMDKGDIQRQDPTTCYR
jgi:alkylation response protein AidB-like acyl-CoA dehydrogenase